MVDWSRYLASLCNTYDQWWQVYTITDVVGRQRVESQPSPLLFDFGLMVQTVEREKGEKEKIERLTVLDGLRKYASEHVLLVGRPGSGKSTALVRLLLEEAEKANLTPQPPSLAGKGEQDSPPILGKERGEHFSPLLAGEGQGERSTQGFSNHPKIPVLVELRYYRTSILDLIQDFLQRHDPNLTVDAETLKSWLRQGQLLLLVDGLNELPSEDARRDLQKFRQDYQKTTPMIFTTRDLGVGGDLDIAKKLEMQPLSEAQMQQFVRAYLAEQGEQMLRQLGSRLREFGQTPLLLWMLCSLFRAMGKVPPNLGLVFRQFAQSYYAKLKQDVPVTEESRDWCQLLLEQLAFRMTHGREKTELQVAISKQETEEFLTAFLRDEGLEQPRNRALKWLKDLLKHHLIQLGAGEQIEFRHQLIQEYYTAESLLKLLPILSDDELKREYLNYLKWTEPLALMLELVEDEAQAVRVVRLALEVDWWLGARLAGAVKASFQAQTVALVDWLEIPQFLKTQLLELAKPERVIPALTRRLEHKGSSVTVTSMLANLAKALEDETLKDEEFAGAISSTPILEKVITSTETPQLAQALDDERPVVRRRAAQDIDKVDSDAAMPLLAKALKDRDCVVRKIAAESLGKIHSDEAVTLLARALEDGSSVVRMKASHALGRIGSDTAIPLLMKALKDENEVVRWLAAEALGKIGTDEAITPLARALEDKNSVVCTTAAYALGKIGSCSAILVLAKFLVHKNSGIRKSVTYALGNVGLNTAIPLLDKALGDRDVIVRRIAAETLGETRSNAAIPLLDKALEDRDVIVRRMTTKLLGKFGSDDAVLLLAKALNDKDITVIKLAVEALGIIGSNSAITPLSKALENKNYDICEIALDALIKIGSKTAITPLNKTLKNEKFYAINHRYLVDKIIKALQSIQERWKFYNYTLTQPNPTPETQPNILSIQPISTSLMHILHLSDLHFGTLDQANLWSNQLAADLYNDLSIPHLDALILSGDIANYSTQEEYKAAEQFLHNLRQDFPLTHQQIILVSGNHDLNWKVTNWEMADDVAYTLKLRKQCKPHELQEGYYIEESANAVWVRDEEKYKQRFAHFSQFYETIKQKPYPLDYDQQYTLDHLKEQNLLILGLNSAWQLDHHFKTRASIHMGALSNALTQIRRNSDYRNCLKIAVWHHPLDSAWEDRITDHGFLEQLAVNGFRFFLHGHIHKAETSLYRYDMSSDGRKLDRICAGTFGAPVREWVPGYPLQYNLLKFEDNQLTVYTRRREELNGAWKPDARWGQGPGKTPLDYYAISLLP
jgi:HEAT repeat protein